MDRTALQDGGWFDKDTAEKFEEGDRFDGSNRVSLATGSEWDHENLYRTRSGRWVLNIWSQRQGSTESYREISQPEAVDWLVRNEHEVPDSLAKVAETTEV